MTLIEVALVLVVLGLLAGMSLPLVTEITKQRHYRSTQRDLEEIKESLAGYAGIYGRLPGADSNGDGRADADQVSGALPYLDLGLGTVDSWRSPYRYEVNQRLTTTMDAASFRMALAAITADELPLLAFVPGGAATPQAVLIVSSGENACLDGENGDSDRTYEAFAPADTFDDLTVALNPNTLYARLDCGISSGPSTSCTAFSVRNRTGGRRYIKGGSYSACTRLNNNAAFTVNSGDTISLFSSQATCLSQSSSSDIVTFASAATADADRDCTLRWAASGLSDE